MKKKREALLNFYPQNLDAMSKEELWEFWAEYRTATKTAAAKLLGPRKDVAEVVQTLANYACNRSVAMGCREKGDITAAACYEHAAELSRNRLPADVRW